MRTSTIGKKQTLFHHSINAGACCSFPSEIRKLGERVASNIATSLMVKQNHSMSFYIIHYISYFWYLLLTEMASYSKKRKHIYLSFVRFSIRYFKKSTWPMVKIVMPECKTFFYLPCRSKIFPS